MKKILLLFIAVFLFAGCQYPVERAHEVEEQINNSISSGQSNIKLKELTHFDWDKAFVFAPYSSSEYISEQLKISFRDPSSIDSRDDIFLIVFVHDDKVIKYATIQRTVKDLETGSKTYIEPH